MASSSSSSSTSSSLPPPKDFGFTMAHPQVIHSQNEQGQTPLHIAALNNDIELVKLLLQKGAVADIRDAHQKTPRDLAQEKFFSDVVQAIDQHTQEFYTWVVSGDMELVDSFGATKLMKSSFFGSERAVVHLLSHSAKINAQDMHGLTALAYAAFQGHTSIVATLLQKGADPTLAAKSGKTPLQLARERNHAACEKLLEQRLPKVTGVPARLKGPALEPSPIKGSVRIYTGPKATLQHSPTTSVEVSLDEEIAQLDEFVMFSAPSANAKNNEDDVEITLDKIMSELPEISVQTLSPPTSGFVPPIATGKARKEGTTIRPPTEPTGAHSDQDSKTSSANTQEELPQTLLRELQFRQKKSRSQAERGQTVLDSYYLMMLDTIVQLVTAVTNKFTAQFVDITAKSIHECGEILREINDAYKRLDSSNAKLFASEKKDDLRDQITTQMKAVDELMQDLVFKTKVTSGVWPPPEAQKEMVQSAFRLINEVGTLIAEANSSGLFPKDVPIPETETAPDSSGLRKLDFKEYKRQQNLKIINEITKVEKSMSPSYDYSAEDEELSAITEADNQFLENLEQRTKSFVAELLSLKKLRDSGQKSKYVEAAQKAVERSVDIGKQVDEKIKSLREEQGGDLQAMLHKLVLTSKDKGADLIVKTNLTLGVWPPPNAEDSMMEAALELASNIKELVASTKTAVIEYRELWQRTVENSRKEREEWDKKLLQHQKIEKLDVLVQAERLEEEVELTIEENEFLEGPADKEGIVFSEESSGEPSTVNSVDKLTDRPIIKGGTLEKLVERLTYFKYPDPEFRKAFLLTYQSFTTPIQLFELLVSRFDQMPPLGLTEKKFSIYFEKKIKPTRLRVFNVLKIWLDDHFEDWADNRELIDAFKEFVTVKMRVDLNGQSQQLMKLLREKLEGLTRSTILTVSNVEMPLPILPKSCRGISDLQEFLRDEKNKNWMNLDPVEFARQMTLIEFAMYEKIQAKECLGQGWNGKTKYVKSPNISAVIDWTNQISSWVSTKLLEDDDIRTRLNVLKFFVTLAQRCRELNNFNSATSILAAFQSSPVHRLKKMWDAFQTERKNKALVTYYEELLQLTNAKGNYGFYRRCLHTINPPVVPYLGVYLTDLTFIEDGNPDFLPNTRLINFDKRKKVSKAIQEIKMYQQSPYSFMEVAPIKDFLWSVRGLDEKLLYDRSLTVEPKQPTMD